MNLFMERMGAHMRDLIAQGRCPWCGEARDTSLLPYDPPENLNPYDYLCARCRANNRSDR